MDKGTVNVNDVILTNQGQIGIVTSIKSGKYPVVYQSKKGANGYHCGYGDVKMVIGKATPEGVAEIEAKEAVDIPDYMLPDKLKGAKSGETKLKLVNGDEVLFMDYKASRPKYPVIYSKNGKQYKTTMNMVGSIIA